MSIKHNMIRLSSANIHERNISAGETSVYPLQDKDKSITEVKTTVRPLAKVIQKKRRLDSPILIAGFPGPGLVGSISTSYIINRLHMEQIACVESGFIVPGVIYAEGKLRHPFRLYSNEEGDVCVLVCEAPVLIQGIYSVLDTVTKWALNNKVKQVMVLDGFPAEGLPNLKRKPIILSSDGEVADAASLIQDVDEGQNNKVENGDNADRNLYPPTAYIGGLLSSCLSNGLPSKALLISTNKGIPDPEGAALLIESLDKITDNKSLEIDTQHLRKQGAALRTRMEKIIQSLRGQQQLQEEGTQESERIRDGVMYG